MRCTPIRRASKSSRSHSYTPTGRLLPPADPQEPIEPATGLALHPRRRLSRGAGGCCSGAGVGGVTACGGGPDRETWLAESAATLTSWAWARPDAENNRQRATVSSVFMTTPHNEAIARSLLLYDVSSVKMNSTICATAWSPDCPRQIAPKVRPAVLSFVEAAQATQLLRRNPSELIGTIFTLTGQAAKREAGNPRVRPEERFRCCRHVSCSPVTAQLTNRLEQP